MKKPIFSLLVSFLFCISLVAALPVTYRGDIFVDGIREDGTIVKVITNLEEYQSLTDNGTYLINAEGDFNTTTDFYVYGELVVQRQQPVQGEVVEQDFNFTRLVNGLACTMNQACQSNACCGGECKSKCRSSSGGGSSSWYITECNDGKDNDGNGLLDYDGNGNISLKDPACLNWNIPLEKQIEEVINETEVDETPEVIDETPEVVDEIPEVVEEVPEVITELDCQPTTLVCDNGSLINTHICKDGELVATGQTCLIEEDKSYMNLFIILGILMVIGIYWVYTFNKNKKLKSDVE